MELRFEGDLTPWKGVALAAMLAAAAALLYLREVRREPARRARLLPLVRAAGVFLLVLMLTGPVLHSARTEPLARRVLVFVDASQSMSVTDESLEPARKLRVMRSLGLLPANIMKENARAEAAEARRLLATNPALKAAAARFDGMSRWQRVESLLLAGPPRLLTTLAHDRNLGFDLYALAGGEAPKVWWSEQSAELSRALPYQPTATTTDLADGLKARTDARGEEAAPPLAAVLLTDGQHNAGPSPLPVARALGLPRLPLYVIGVGGTTPPPDLAVLSAEGPETVYLEDRARGQVLLRDTMPRGKNFTLRIARSGDGVGAGAQPVWEETLTTDGSGLRRIDYDFPIAPAAAAEMGRLALGGVEGVSVPLAFTVTVTPIEGEQNQANNQAPLLLRAIKSKRKVLLIDGRPRWEYRFLRNLLERDKQWEVNALVAGVERVETGLVRGSGPGSFPRDKETLDGYDLVIFGEAPPGMLSAAELGWLRDFVAERGGGMVFIDGPRAMLRLYAGTPLGALLPVQWRGEAAAGPWTMRLTPRGGAIGALDLASGAAANAGVWASLPGPHWIAPAAALPDAETLVEAVTADSHRAAPLVVSRRYGAGRVWYAGFDESWRWRYDAEDRYTARYWNQVANWVMEPPYAMRDRYVSLDVGALRYKAGEAAQVRARVHDERGRPIPGVSAEAVLYKDGREMGTIPLTGEANPSGRLRGQSGALEPGRYEVGVRVHGLPETQMKARVAFQVAGETGGELSALTCNEELLKQMAEASGGRYFREEDAAGVAPFLDIGAATRTIETNTPLWHGWPWFGVVVGLFTIEWLLRKSVGMA